MRPAVDALLAVTGGVASRARLLSVLTRGELDDEIRRGRLVAVFAHTYARPWDADDPALRDRAALVCVGPPATLSQVTALRRWQLPVPAGLPRHVTVTGSRHPRGLPGELVVHRSRIRPPSRMLDGLPTAVPEVAIVGSWPLLTGARGRAPAIEAVRRRLVTPTRLRVALAREPKLPRRRAFGELIELLEAGCESELEAWGYLHVFDVPELRQARRQRPIRVGGRTYRLDLAYEDERVAIELDGRAFHSSTEQWERDTRRDLALATIGWQTIRMSHHRLTNEVQACRRDALAVLRARRSLAS